MLCQVFLKTADEEIVQIYVRNRSHCKYIEDEDQIQKLYFCLGKLYFSDKKKLKISTQNNKIVFKWLITLRDPNTFSFICYIFLRNSEKEQKHCKK